MGFPDEPLSMNPLMDQWEKNQAVQGNPVEGTPAPAQPEGPGLAVPPPPGGGIEVSGLPSYLTDPSSAVPSPGQTQMEMAVTEPPPPVPVPAPVPEPPETDLPEPEVPETPVEPEPPETTQAVIYQRGLSLAATELPEDKLVWKVACKTGKLALSPGPGQTDAETPLHLTPDLFSDMKLSFDEKAFPYVTVPETHANGALENTGYVRKVDVLDHNQALGDNRIPERFRDQLQADPHDTQYLLTGIEFTEPGVREKALNGTIPDTSIGVKFNYRNKRSGTNYKAAFEHLALTPVPWVDGLVPFGLSQQGGVFDQEFQADVPYTGVFTEIELSPLKSKTRNSLPDSAFAVPSERKFPIHDESHARNALSRAAGTKYEAQVRAAVKKRYPNIGTDASAPVEGEGLKLGDTGDTLSPEHDRGRIPPTSQRLSVESETEEPHMPRTVEEILAEERAAREAAEARLAEMEQNLSLAQGTISSQGEQLHTTSVAEKVRKLQGRVPPVLLLAAKRIYEADKPGVQTGGLELSVQNPVKDAEGKPGLTELKLDSATKIVDYLLASAPAISGAQATQIASVFDGIDNLVLAQDPGAEEDDDAAKIKAVEAYERESHPERFADNGKGERL